MLCRSKNSFVILVASLSWIACSAEPAPSADTANPGGKADSVAGMLEIGEPDSSGDGYGLEELRVEGNMLIVGVSYGGGCEEHEFRLFWDGSVLESLPPQANLVLTHDGNDDFCEAFLYQELSFDISALGDTEIILNVGELSVLFGGAAGASVQLGDPESTGDGYTIEDARLEGDSIVLTVSYGGGCEEHEFELYWNGLVLETFPVQANLVLTHDGGDDFCEAYITEELRFSLGPLAEFAGEEGAMIVNIAGFSLAI